MSEPFPSSWLEPPRNTSDSVTIPRMGVMLAPSLLMHAAVWWRVRPHLRSITQALGELNKPNIPLVVELMPQPVPLPATPAPSPAVPHAQAVPAPTPKH